MTPQERWETAGLALGDHRYLATHGLRPDGLRQDGDLLLVAAKDIETRAVVGTLAIGPDGTIHSEGRLAGAMASIGASASKATVHVCASWAAGARIHAETGCPVAVAFEDSNVRAVAEAMRQRYPEARIVIASEARPKPSVLPMAGDSRPEEGIRHPESVGAILEAAGVSNLGGDAAVGAVEQALDALADLACDLPPLRLALLREAACKALKAAGISSPAKVVDAALGASEEEEEGRQGRKLVLEDVEPWHDAVDGAGLLEELVRTFTRFLALPEGAPTALALWTVHAHAHEAAAVSPLLGILSPEKRCGKTTTLHVVSALVPRPLPASNITPAAVYRAVETHRPTMLVDEADTFLKEREELRGLLNSGHTRSGAVVVRCAEPDYEARLFSTWAPKVVAMIGDLPSTIEDRSVLIKMRRRAPDETVERLRLDRLAELEPIRRRIARWARDNMRALASLDPDVPPELHDRAADNWRPLLAIADRAGGDWPERARSAARLLTGVESAEDSSVQVMLLSDLRSLFNGRDRLTSQEIIDSLARLEHRPWPEWKKGKPISARGLARMLNAFGVKPKPMAWGDAGSKGTRGYAREDFADAFSRYLPPSDPQTPQPSSNGAGLRGSRIRNPEAAVAFDESDESPCVTTKVAEVALEDGGLGAESPDSEVPDLWATIPDEAEVGADD